MNREELSKYRYKLVDSIHKHCVDQEGYVLAYKVADFIIEDRKRICEPLIGIENVVDSSIKTDGERRRYAQIFNKKRKEAINETLKLAGLDKDREERIIRRHKRSR